MGCARVCTRGRQQKQWYDTITSHHSPLPPMGDGMGWEMTWGGAGAMLLQLCLQQIGKPLTRASRVKMPCVSGLRLRKIHPKGR